MAQDIINENQKISYTNLDFSAIYTETLDLIKQLTYRWDPSISDESDPGVVLVKLSALLADKLNYNIDKNVLETFPLSVTQDGNARQLYDQLGYYMDWYQSGMTYVTLNYSAQTEVDAEVITYKIPKFTPVCDVDQTASKRYTLIGAEGVDGPIVSDTLLTTDGKQVIVVAMEGFPVQYQFENETVITSQMVDPNSHRLYFTTKYISQNGIFIKNTGQDNYAEWHRVNNLYENSYNDLRYMFGYDSYTDTCFIEFPDNYAELFGSGIEITYLVIDPTAGDIMINELTQFITPIVVKSVGSTNEEVEITLGTDNVTITNYLASSGHTNIEGLNEAYTNYKKTVGTFKTLITLRDYLNFIRNEDLNICSNAFVCDRTNDIQTVYKIISKHHNLDSIIVKVEQIVDDTAIESIYDYKFILSDDRSVVAGKTYYKVSEDNQSMVVGEPVYDPKEERFYELATIEPKKHDSLEPFALKFFLLKKAVSLNTKDAYNETFSMLDPYPDFYSLFSDTAHIEHTFDSILPLGKNYYKKSLDTYWDNNKSYWLWDIDTETYNLITDITLYDGSTPEQLSNVYEIKVEALMPHTVFFKAFYPVVLNIATFSAVDADTQDVIMSNIVQNLYTKTACSEMEFGEEVSLDYLSTIAKESDTRIKSVTVEPLEYYLYATYYDENEKAYIEVRIDDSMETFYPESYQNLNDIVIAQIKKDIVAKSILAGTSQLLIPDTKFMYHLSQKFISFREDISNIESEAIIDISEAPTTYSIDASSAQLRKTYTLQPNELLTLFRPSLDTLGEYLNGIHYEYVTNNTIKADSSYKLGIGEYFILYEPLKNEESNTIEGYIAHCCGEGCIVKSTFKILPNTSVSSLTNFAKAQILPYFETTPLANYYKTTTYNNTYMTEIRNNSAIINNAISGNDSILLQDVKTITITTDKKYNFFWALNEPTYSSNDNIKTYTLFNQYDSENESQYSEKINTYTLKAGEVLLYTNADKTAIETLGAGTTLIRNCGVDTSEYTPIENSIYYAYTEKLASIVENSSFTELTTENNINRPRESGWYEVDIAVKFNNIIDAQEFEENTQYSAGQVCIYDNKYYISINGGAGPWRDSDWHRLVINWRTTEDEIKEFIESTDINPYAVGLYEGNSNQPTYYIPSTDTSFNTEKTYYVVFFTRTFDQTAISNKSYYILVMHKEEGSYYKTEKPDEDGLLKINYVADPLNTGCFEKVNIANYNNPKLINPVELGYYKKMEYNNEYYVDTYSYAPNYEPTEQNRFASAADIFTTNLNDTGNEYYEHDSSIINRKILTGTKYSSLDLSNLDTYLDLDLNQDTFNPVTLKLLEPTKYAEYFYDSEGLEPANVSYLTNPYKENLWVKVIIDDGDEERVEYHSCHDERKYICFTPEVLDVKVTTNAAMFSESPSIFSLDIGGKGYYYKANSNGTIYRVKNKVNDVPWLSAASEIDSTVSPLKALYNLYVSASSTQDYDPENPTKWLDWVEGNWSSSASFQMPHYKTPVDFSTASTYEYDQLVMYSPTPDIPETKKPYRCRVASFGPGEWDPDCWYEINLSWRAYKFEEVQTKTIGEYTSAELQNLYVKVKASTIMDKQIMVGTIYPAFDYDEEVGIADPNYYVQAMYYRSLGISTTDYPYSRIESLENEEDSMPLDNDEKLMLIFPNKKYDINNYGNIQLYYLPKLYKFNDYVRFTSINYYEKKDLYNKHCEVIDAWTCSALDVDDLAKQPKKTIANMWTTLQTNTSLTIIENEIKTLSAGDKIIFSTSNESVSWPKFSNNEEILYLDEYDVAYQQSGEEIKYLDYIDVDDYKWRGYSSLLISASNEVGQKLEENHIIKLFNDDSSLEPFATIQGKDGQNISVQFKNKVESKTGSYISVVTKNILGDDELNSIYVYEPFNDGDYYKYNTVDNTTALYFNSTSIDPDDPDSGLIPQKITLPFGLPGGEYLLSCCMMDDVIMTIINNNMLVDIDGVDYNLDAPVVNDGEGYTLDDDFVNYLHSYMNEKRTKFTNNKYDYIYMNTGNGQFRKIKAPSLIAISLSPAELGWYEKSDQDDTFYLTEKDELGTALLETHMVEEIDESINPKELGWYEQTASSYNLSEDEVAYPNKTYYSEPNLYVSLDSIYSELIFTIDKNNKPITYTLDDVFKFEQNPSIGTFDLIREKIQALDVDEEYNYTFVPQSNDLIENPLKAKSFFNKNHIFNKNLIPQLDFDNLDSRFTTIR